ncbi:hypothetical protein ARMSODRAFT_976378 [Armillaria solidipes]|uniref:Uncharacterized protein n=1 Tax=Armillaria solidipes TaxID=1076256 RepID=A0A2H3BW35_9AGAR|nr:hypothetical protein ARMSODRAFT_976378 [Armillaria solidipes]
MLNSILVVLCLPLIAVSALPAEKYTGFNASWPAGVKHTLPILEINYEINPPKIYAGNNEPRAVAPNRPAADKNRASSNSYGKVDPNRRSTRCLLSYFCGAWFRNMSDIRGPNRKGYAPALAAGFWDR